MERTKQIIKQCNSFAAEYHLDQDSDPGQLANLLRAPAGYALRDRIPAHRYRKYRLLLKKAVGLDLKALQGFRPLVISNMIDEHMMPPATMRLTLDHYLWNYAREQGLQMRGLESMADQVETLRKISPEEELSALLRTLRNIPTHRRQLRKLFAWYLSGDIWALYQASRKGLGQNRKRLLYGRNRNMATRLIELASQQSTFAAVGAAHLAGDQGLLALLKRAGFRLHPVR